MANIGETREGRTGTYKYIGGDEKDKNSWELVTPTTAVPAAAPVQPPQKSNIGGAVEYGLEKSIPFAGSKLNPLNLVEVLNRYMTSGTPPAGLSTVERLKWMKPKVEPPTPVTGPEKAVAGASNIASTIAQAGMGAGLGGGASRALGLPKAATEVAQLAGASAPGVTKAVELGGPEAGTQTALLDMLLGGLTKGAGGIVSKLLPKQALSKSQEAANAVENLMGRPPKYTGPQEPTYDITKALKRAQKSLGKTKEGKILTGVMGKEEASRATVSGYGTEIPKKMGPKEISETVDKASGAMGDIKIELPNILRDVQSKVMATPGKLAGHANTVKSLSDDAAETLGNIADAGWKLTDVNDMRRTYAALAAKESDPIKKKFYDEMVKSINDRLSTSPQGGVQALEKTPGSIIRAEQEYLKKSAEQKAKDEARAATMKKWLIRGGISAGVGGSGLWGVHSIADILSGR